MTSVHPPIHDPVLPTIWLPGTANPDQGVPAWLRAIEPAALGGIDFLNGRSHGMDYSFARASSGYARNPAGVYVSFPTDALRIAELGALIEPARTNLVTNNTGNSGGMTLVGTTRVDTAPGDSPANDNSGKLITQGAGATDSMTFGAYNNVVTAGSRHAVSVDLAYTGSARYLRIVLSDNVSVVNQCWVDLVDNVVTNLTAGASATLVTTAWGVRIEFVTATYPNTTSNGQMQVIATTGLGSATRSAGHYKMWGGQVEKDQVTVTSPILTSGTIATRAADNLGLERFSGSKLRFTFDNDTTQDVAGISAPYQVPTDLNRAIVKNVVSLAA